MSGTAPVPSAATQRHAPRARAALRGARGQPVWPARAQARPSEKADRRQTRIERMYQSARGDRRRLVVPVVIGLPVPEMRDMRPFRRLERLEARGEVPQRGRLLDDPEAAQLGGALRDVLARPRSRSPRATACRCAAGSPAAPGPSAPGCSEPSGWRPNITVPISQPRMPPSQVERDRQRLARVLERRDVREEARARRCRSRARPSGCTTGMPARSSASPRYAVEVMR